MPSAETRNVKTVNLNEVRITGSFPTNGNQNPASKNGRGFTVTRADVGKYRIVFTEKHPKLIAFHHSVRCVDGIAPAGVFTKGGQYVAASKQIDLWVLQEGGAGGAYAPADLAANADNVVSFEAVFFNDTVE